jgi:hypothetical protein
LIGISCWLKSVSHHRPCAGHHYAGGESPRTTLNIALHNKKLDLQALQRANHAMTKDLLLAPLVVAQRAPLLWLEMCGLGQGSRESERMVEEKFAAVAEGAMAMQVEMQSIWWQSTLAVWQGIRPPSLMQAGSRLTQAGLRPAARRVKSNAKRLAAPKIPRSRKKT